jgi:hypothetical protein
MLYETVQDPELDFNERLRMEVGWGDVTQGLTGVLVGYCTLFLGTAIGFGMMYLSLSGLADGSPQKGARPSNFSYWMLYLGMGILSVIGFIAYTIIIGGQFKCMMGAAERYGARWFMFACIACLFFGPAFHFASGIANWQALQELKKNPGAVREFQLNPMGQWLQLIGFAISMLYPLCFVLFLRAVALCLRADLHAKLVTTFLVVATSAVAATGWVLYKHPPGGRPIPPEHALMILVGWGAILLLYAGLIMVMRGCIATVMSNLKSPLDM